jgi:anti-sigma factor RsiW
MKRSLDDCTCYRESISLLASGVLPEPERAVIESHLAICPHCQKYFNELQMLVQPLTNWEQSVGHVEPDKAFQARWEKAIQSVDGQSREDHNAFANLLYRCWQELFWPCRRVWSGLAATWLAVLLFNSAQTGNRPIVTANSATLPGEMRLAWQEQQRVLAEIIGPSSPASPAEPSRRPNHQPRSQLRPVATA